VPRGLESVYLISLGEGLLVGVIYSSSTVGLLGILLDQQIIRWEGR
jgi:xanthosine utilization system XapX-like protein